MKIAFNPSTVAALIAPPNNKDITFDLRGHNIFARGVKFCGTDTNTWRDIKINNVSIGSNILDLRDGDNTTLTNINGVVTINSTWRPVVDNLTSDSTTSSLSANQGRVLKALIDGKSDSDHNHDDRYVKKSGDTMSGVLTIDTTNFGALIIQRNDDDNGASIQFRGKSSVYGYIGLNNSTKDKQFLRWGSDTSKTYTILDTSSTYVSNGKGIINGTTITQVSNADTTDGVHLEWSGQLTYDQYSWLAGWTNDGKKIKAVNKSQFATSGHTHDDRYLKLSGGTMTGIIRATNRGGSWISGRDHCLIRSDDKTSYSYWSAILAIATVNGYWTLGHLGDGGERIGFNYDTDADYNAGRNNNHVIWLPTGGAEGTLALTSDIPSSLKNPYALTISLNGTSQGPYDGSAAKNINITPGSIGAATSGHNHDSSYVKYTKVTKSTADNANATPYLYNVENEEVISGYYKYWYIFNMGQYSRGNFGTQIAMPYQDSLTDSELFIRSAKSGSWRTWRRILHSNNYASILDSRYYTKSEVNTKLGTYLSLSGGTVTGNIILKGGTSADMTYAGNVHPYIRFDNSDSSQNVSLIFTDYDTYRRPAGIKLVGNQGNEWFEAANIYATTFYGALSGNASSANKLTTARNIALGTDLRGSANFDGSSNITISANINACTVQVSSTNGLPFKRIAHFETGSSWNDNALLLYISQGYINGSNGICRVEFRTDNISSSSTSVTASAAVRWLVRNGYGLDSLYAGYYVTTNKAYIDIYLKTTGGYQGTVIRVLQDSRGGINSNVQLINSYYYSDTNHKEAYNSIEAASTALYNRAYTRIVSGSDVGTVSYSNSTGSVHWNNVTNKPNTFTPAAHTHTVFNNNLMIKGTNGISDSASIHLGIGDSDTGFKWISDGKCQIYANNAAVGEWTSGGMNWFKNPTVNGNKIWNAGNDGSGSGLDADLLDGWHLDSIRKNVGYSWSAKYRINNWSRIIKIDNYSNILLAINFAQNNQASNHLYLISTGYGCGNIVQLGANGYNSNSAIKIRLTENTATSHNVEIYSTYGYNGATELSINCNYTRIDGNSTITTYLTYTAGGGTVRKEITSSYSKIVANLEGNASTATALTTNAGNSINPIYFSGGKPVACTMSTGRGNGIVRSFSRGTYTSANQYFGNGTIVTIDPKGTGCISENDTILSLGDLANRNTQLLVAYDRDGVYYRRITDGLSYGDWKRLAFTTDNVASATKLATARMIWGQSFDGTRDVSGSLVGTGTITASAAATYDIGSNTLDYRYGYFQWIGAKSNTNLRLAANNSDNQIVLHTNGNVGIGTNAPAYKLHVNGTFRATNSTVSDLFVNTGDATLKIYTGKTTGAQNDGNICFQTSIDATDGQSHTYPTQYQSRCNIVLQPRGGQVYIGTNPGTGNTTYKLYVNSKIFSNGGFVKNGSSDSYVLLGGGGHKAVSDFAISNHTHGLLHSNLTVNLANTTTDSGWSMINSSYNGFLLKSIRTQGSAPNWIENNYAAGICFGGADTKGVVSVAYGIPYIKFAGGNGSKPVWWIRLSGTSGATYNLANFNADTLDGVHLNGIFTAFQANGNATRLVIGGVTKDLTIPYASKAGSVAWDSITDKPSSFTPSSHTHSWTSITDKLVAGNEFNIVNAGFNADIWFNYKPINDSSKTASIHTYIMGNGAKGMASVTASGFIKNGSNSNYVLLGDGGHKLESSLRVAYASNADMVDGYHATSGRTFTGNINWSDNWNDTWSDGTNKHPWYGFDHRYPNTGAYSTTISDYFGMTIKTANTLRLDFGTLLLNGTSIYSINVASATKLQTARSIWGHSFNGTADVNGTIYINNSNSSNGAIRLNNNVNSNARISAIGNQVIFNTGNAIRFGETAWDWNVWAGLKYTHSNKTIYLGIADNSIFNANSAQSGGSLRFPGISNVYATTFNGSLSGNASTATNADKLDGTHLSGIFTAFGNNAHNITATIGGVTKSFLVNWAADSDKLDGYHENSFLRYRGDTSTDQEATLWSQIGIKQYNNALPDNLTGVYNYGSVISLPGSSSRFEIYASHQSSNGNGLYYRSGWGSDKKTWLKFIDSSNIGSQSVNYANSAGNADKLDGIHANGLLTALSNSNNGISITVGGTTKSVSNISVNYASSAGSATKVIVNQHTTNDTNYPLVWSNQSNTNSVTENQLYKSWSDLYYNPKNKRLTVGGSVVASSFVKRGGTSQQLLRADGGIAAFNWSGQSGQPSWLWGGNNEHSYYVYNPSNFRVAYATSAGSADTAQYLRSLGNQNCQTGRTQNYGDVYSYNTIYSNTGAPTDYTSVIGFGRGIGGTVEIAGGWCNTGLYWRSLRDCCEDWYSWRTVLDSSNYTGYVDNYYWANVKISTSSSTTTSPTVSNLTATSSIRMSNIQLEHTDEINNITNGNIYLNYRNSGNVSLCQGGGKVGISTISPSHELDVMGNTFTTGFGIRPYYLSNSGLLPTISPGDGYTYRCLEIGRSAVVSCIIADRVALSNERGVLIKFNTGFDGQIVLLKDLQNYGDMNGNGYFWVMPSGCKIIRPDGSSTQISYNQISNAYDDGKSRFFVYSYKYDAWIEFYCG